jgi:hypothetical protein
MITNALREAIARLLVSPVPRIEIDADVTHAPARTVGQILHAQLAANLPNGRSLIDVEGFRFDVKLPLAMRRGETMRLQVLALEPRLTFALLGAPAGASADAVSVSDAVRHLTALLDRLSNETGAAPPARTMPLTSTPPANATELAQALQGAVARSGLFYESHQAQYSPRSRIRVASINDIPRSLRGRSAPTPGGSAPCTRMRFQRCAGRPRAYRDG